MYSPFKWVSLMMLFAENLVQHTSVHMCVKSFLNMHAQLYVAGTDLDFEIHLRPIFEH